MQILTEIPTTSIRTLKKSFSKEAIVPWAGITASTMFLWANDQNYLEDVQRWGRDSGIGNADNTKTILELGPYPIFRFPSDTGSSLYFLGDGWTHGSIAAGFFLSGYIYPDHDRAWNTSMQLVHGMIVSTMFSQALKRSTGRESPSESTEPRGKWRPFPSVRAYGQQTPMYDAFPSGHVMTATLTFTIINSNYPEYAWYTVPAGVTWVTLLSLQMMNNGVHWASDYPLGIAMGYVIGKLSTQIGKPDEPTAEGKTASMRPIIFPSVFDGVETLNVLMTY